MSDKLPKYFPELDGLRAIAVCTVLLHHLHMPGFAIGWAGVELFFVISGFLITGILLDSRGNEHYFRNFYARRTLRIFPIYYLSLGVIIIISIFAGWPLKDCVYYIFYMQNYPIGLHVWEPHFSLAFNHYWSLALEEQFYLMWPLLIFFVQPRSLRIVIPLIAAFGLASRIALFYFSDNRLLLFILLPPQVELLCAGAFLALLARQPNITMANILRPARLLLVISGIAIALLILHTGQKHYGAVDFYSASRGNILMLTLMAIFFASAIALLVLRPPQIAAILHSSFFRHIGKISYGLYLYHYPIFYFISRFGAGSEYRASVPFICGISLLKIVLTYGITLLSWNLIELRLNALKSRFS